jgi:hypothetical protein
MMQLIPYHHRSPTAWLDALPLALRAALLRPRPPESDPEVIILDGWMHRIFGARVDLRSGAWRRWLASAEGEAWLASPAGQRWLAGPRGGRWMERMVNRA